MEERSGEGEITDGELTGAAAEGGRWELTDVEGEGPPTVRWGRGFARWRRGGRRGSQVKLGLEKSSVMGRGLEKGRRDL